MIMMTTNVIKTKLEILEEAQHKLDWAIDQVSQDVVIKILDVSEDRYRILFSSSGKMVADQILRNYIDEINPKKYHLGKIEIVIGMMRFLVDTEEED
jgi:hypothetical protein